MSLRTRLFGPKEAPDDGAGYSRKSFKSGQALTFYDKDVTDKTVCRRMYTQGGMVGEAIDAYALFAFANGYTLEGDDGPMKDKCQAFLDANSIEELGHQLIVDALVIPDGNGSGKGYAEIVWNRAHTEIVSLQYRPAETFEEVLDSRGNVQYYQQSVVRDNQRITVQLPKENVLVIDLHMPLVKRAFKDINIDAAVADATATSIQRHGYPRYHVKLGAPGEAVSQDVLKSHGHEFEELKPNMEWTTTHDVEVTNIDTAGVMQTQQYNNWAVQRLAAALGVPEEMLSLGRGSTEATANVRLETFKLKVGSVQHQFAAAISKQVMDLITGMPGAVWYRFNEVSLDEMIKKADIVTKLTANPVDPYAIVTPQWCQEFMGVEVREDTL